MAARMNPTVASNLLPAAQLARPGKRPNLVGRRDSGHRLEYRRAAASAATLRYLELNALLLENALNCPKAPVL